MLVFQSALLQSAPDLRKNLKPCASALLFINCYQTGVICLPTFLVKPEHKRMLLPQFLVHRVRYYLYLKIFHTTHARNVQEVIPLIFPDFPQIQICNSFCYVTLNLTTILGRDNS